MALLNQEIIKSEMQSLVLDKSNSTVKHLKLTVDSLEVYYTKQFNTIKDLSNSLDKSERKNKMSNTVSFASVGLNIVLILILIL